jgi:hypothetical protein
VTSWRATTCGRRRAKGVTRGPSTTRSVAVAAAARHSHGSAIDGVPHAGFQLTWSQRNTPSQPAASASAAIDITVRGSDQSSNGGSVIPKRTDGSYCRDVRRSEVHGDRGMSSARTQERRARVVQPHGTRTPRSASVAGGDGKPLRSGRYAAGVVPVVLMRAAV